MKISQNILDARKLLSEIEQLNANPALIDVEIIYKKAIDLDVVIQQMIITTAKMLDL
jgi:hypothetical protein